MAAVVRVSSDPRPALAATLCRDYTANAAILCGSGTQALQLALLVAQDQCGSDAVALPAFSCYDVVTAAVGASARMVLYDLDPGTLGPDLDSLGRALEEGARAVVVAPLYGIPVDWAALNDLAAQHGAVLVEDAAQGHGASWRGRPLGGLGSLSVLSFGRGKGWTGGRGGALLLRGENNTPSVAEFAADDNAGDPGVDHELTVLSATMVQLLVARPALFALPAAITWLGLGETRYRSPRAALPITRAGAAIVVGSRGHAAVEAESRRSHGAWYANRLNRVPDVVITPTTPESAPGYLRFPVRIAAGIGAFADPGRARRLGISPSYPTTLASLKPVRRRLARSEPRCPGAEELVRTLVTLPTHSRVTSGERNMLMEMLGSRDASPSSPVEVLP